jgi:hypothetical protein
MRLIIGAKEEGVENVARNGKPGVLRQLQNIAYTERAKTKTSY